MFLDVTKDWTNVSESKTQTVELRVDGTGGIWTGTGNVITDADGLSWLRVDLNKSTTGDLGELVAKALLEGKKLNVLVGKAPKTTDWDFDLKGAKAAYDKMAGEKKPASTGGSGLVIHEYTRKDDWGIHYYTTDKGKFDSVFMIRYYDDGRIVRMTLDKTHFHLDLAGDWKAADAKGDSVPVNLVLNSQKEEEGIKVTGKIINQEGDKWLRLSEPLDEPGSLQDIGANATTLNVIFSSKGKWTYDLKSSNAAWAKVTECQEKYKK